MTATARVVAGVGKDPGSDKSRHSVIYCCDRRIGGRCVGNACAWPRSPFAAALGVLTDVALNLALTANSRWAYRRWREIDPPVSSLPGDHPLKMRRAGSGPNLAAPPTSKQEPAHQASAAGVPTALGCAWGRSGAADQRHLGGQQWIARDNEPRGQLPFHSEVLGRESPGARFHCDDACGGCGPGLTRRFTGLVPLP
jgi:hypothetical protein